MENRPTWATITFWCLIRGTSGEVQYGNQLCPSSILVIMVVIVSRDSGNLCEMVQVILSLYLSALLRSLSLKHILFHLIESPVSRVIDYAFVQSRR